MFESAACCRLRVMAVPTVGCDALLELKALLRTAQRRDSGSVIEAQHHSLLTAGGADATREPTTTRATHALSSLSLARTSLEVRNIQRHHRDWRRAKPPARRGPRNSQVRRFEPLHPESPRNGTEHDQVSVLVLRRDVPRFQQPLAVEALPRVEALAGCHDPRRHVATHRAVR
jgi:hypothetical protein